MKRSEIRRRTPLPRGTSRLRSASSKRARLLRERRKVVERLVEQRGEACEAQLPGLCDGRAVDCHEMKTRGRGGSIVDPANLMLACRSCHSFITENPEWALRNGFTRSSWEAA